MAKKGSKRGAPGGGSLRRKQVKKGEKVYAYWEARITTGFDPGTGRQTQRSFSGKTQKEVREKMQAALVELARHEYREPTKITVGEWLDIWEKDYLNSVKPLTRLNYAQHIKNHIRPALGGKRLDELVGADIQRFYNQLIKTGRKMPKHTKSGNSAKKDGKNVCVSASLSAKTVKNIHGVLHRALQQAVKLGYIRTNPADTCDLAKTEKREITPLDADATAKFMDAIRGHTFETLYLTMLFTGMRRGEACGLLWDCVDLDKGTITINKQLQNIPGERGCYRLVSTKNGKGRTLKVASFVVNLLLQHMEAQEKAKLNAGPLWHDEGYVFCNDIGEHLSPHTVYHNFKRIVASIGMPNARLHDLRHSYAVASLQAGDDVKTVQSNLGHHTASFTLDVYGHVTEQMKQASAARLDEYIKLVQHEKGN